MKQKLILLVQCIVIAFAAMAQQPNAAAEMQKIKAWYSGPELKHVAGQMLLVNKTTNQQMDKVAFEYWIKDNKAFTKMNYIEMLSNDSVYVMVNHKRKSIAVRPAGSGTAAPTSFFDAGQMSKLLATKGVSATITQANGLNRLTIAGPLDSRFSSITIIYDPTDSKVREVEAAVKPGGEPQNQQLVLQVKYSTIEKTNSANAGSVFSTAKYIRQAKDGSINFTQTYQGYKKL